MTSAMAVVPHRDPVKGMPTSNSAARAHRLLANEYVAASTRTPAAGLGLWARPVARTTPLNPSIIKAPE